MLAAELRNPAALIACFSVVDVEKGEQVLGQWQDENAWWTGLEAVTENKILLHGFSDESKGAHAGIKAVNVYSGTVAWQQPQLRYVGALENFVVGQLVSQPEQALWLLNENSGELIKQVEQSTTFAEQLHRFEAALQQHVQRAVQHTEESPYFAQLASFVRRYVAVAPLSAIDYLETASHIILGYYFRNEKGDVQQDVLVTDLAGNLVAQQTLAAACNGLGVDNFFIFRNILICIQNKTTLIGFVL
ncbi:MAG: DUF4905 domain-containing protein [Hymenobacteraceae bacterium]|nr:DUF4905 domain-containing protein [Hymenobacteraceae bacterium]MDX5395117.1 DUF4905 domain-containing protein [Hymenobacteraceae bacterium]MDX5443353.1 DUF4905 domain-containing protein [Hymenobacteraceae bacterium]MDX5511155.1 DUF4905 domain-containing protein [Hymenobacteraceae bacterium]